MNPIIKERIPFLNNPDQFSEMQFKIINQNPPVVRISNLLSPDDCQHLINLAQNKLSPSTMIVGNKEVVNPSRSSRSAYLTKNGILPNDQIIRNLLLRCAELIGYPIKHFEGMKVVNYQKGQEYKAHYDFFRHHDNFTKKIGDRIMTFFIYLNTLQEEDGGCTSFPKLGIKSKPKAGDAMFWINMDFEGNYFEETFHAGEPVLGETDKWGVNIWIRQEAY